MHTCTHMHTHTHTHTTITTWAATHCLQQIYFHFWRVDAVMLGACHGWRQSPRNCTAQSNIVIYPWCSRWREHVVGYDDFRPSATLGHQQWVDADNVLPTVLRLLPVPSSRWAWRVGVEWGGGGGACGAKASVYGILPPTTTITGYASGLKPVS